MIFEAAYSKTYIKTCATSEDSDQPAHPCSLISLRRLHVPSTTSRLSKERNTRKLTILGGCTGWSESYCRFCCVLFSYFSLHFVFLFFLILRVIWDTRVAIDIMKTSLFKYTENFTTKKWKCSDKNSDIFHISAQKHRLWVFVRTASCSKHRLWILIRTASMRQF